MSEKAHNVATTWRDRAVIGIFLLVIATPLGAKLMRFEPAAPQLENRRLAKLPSLSLSTKSLDAFPAAFEAYYKDHFGLRSQFIRWHHIVKLRLLRVSPSPNVVLGKDGWLFDDDMIAYVQARPFTNAELEEWRMFFEEKERFASAEGAAYFLAFAPSPTSIYSEALPDWVRRPDPESRLDQLLRHLRTQSRLSVIDLRGPLLQAKSQIRLYHRTDSHWNDHGAYVAYREIMQAVAKQFPGTDPLPRSAFEPRVQIRPGGDIARMLALPDLLREESLDLVPLTPRRSRIVEWLPEGSAPPPAAFSMQSGDESKPSAVVYHDSFTYASLYPFLAEHFSEVWFHWSHYYGPGLQVSLGRGEPLWNLTRMATMRRGLRPAVVIQEFAERSLLYEPLHPWAETVEGAASAARDSRVR